MGWTDVGQAHAEQLVGEIASSEIQGSQPCLSTQQVQNWILLFSGSAAVLSSHVLLPIFAFVQNFSSTLQKSRKSGQRWKVFHDLPRLLVVIKFYFANMATRCCEGGCYYWNIQARPLMGTPASAKTSQNIFFPFCHTFHFQFNFP